MICPKCGSDIPSDFHFCGMCGEPLQSPAIPAAKDAESDGTDFVSIPVAPVATMEPVAYASVEEAHAPARTPALTEENVHEPGISGPSFLGLSEGATEAGDPYSYLLEDEPRRGYGAVLVLIVLLVILGAVAWPRRSVIRNYVATLHNPLTSLYPKTVNHSDSGLTSDVKPPEQASVPPQPAVAANPPASADQPQITVQEQEAQLAGGGKQKAAAPAEHAAEAPRAPEKASPGASADNSTPQTAPSDPSSAAQDKEEKQVVPPKPEHARPVTEKQTKEEPGAKMLLRGENYLYGRGVPRNCDQAVIYLKAAANAGNPAARSHLGALYSAGECVTRDRVAAYHWFALASRAEHANPWLESNLNMLWRDMSPDERHRVGRER